MENTSTAARPHRETLFSLFLTSALEKDLKLQTGAEEMPFY